MRSSLYEHVVGGMSNVGTTDGRIGGRGRERDAAQETQTQKELGSGAESH